MAEDTNVHSMPPVSRVEVFPEFEFFVRQAKQRELAHANTLLGDATAVIPPVLETLDTDGQAVDFGDPRDPANLRAARKAIDQRATLAMSLILGEQDGQLGTNGDLEAAANQADAIYRRHRALCLRHATLARRMAHAVGRRQSHAVEGGLYDRKVMKPVVSTLAAAKS